MAASSEEVSSVCCLSEEIEGLLLEKPLAAVVEEPVDVSRPLREDAFDRTVTAPRCLRLVLQLGQRRVCAFEGSPLRGLEGLQKGTVLRIQEARRCGDFLRLEAVDLVSSPPPTEEPPEEIAKTDGAPAFAEFTLEAPATEAEAPRKRFLRADVTDLALADGRLAFTLRTDDSIEQVLAAPDLNALLLPGVENDKAALFLLDNKLRPLFLTKSFTFELVRRRRQQQPEKIDATDDHEDSWEVRNLR